MARHQNISAEDAAEFARAVPTASVHDINENHYGIAAARRSAEAAADFLVS